MVFQYGFSTLKIICNYVYLACLIFYPPVNCDSAGANVIYVFQDLPPDSI